nr:MAG TPA: hypothetical protein [Bacteriophage sp.]
MKIWVNKIARLPLYHLSVGYLFIDANEES